MQEQLNRIEGQLNRLIVSVEHRISVLETNVLWLKRSCIGIASFGFSLLVYVIQPFF